MKKMLVFAFLSLALVLNAQDYDYLQVLVANGEKSVSLRVKPKSLGSNFLERSVIETVNFQDFLNVEPGITRPEGFFLCQELSSWEKKNDYFQASEILEQARCAYVQKLARGASSCLFADSLKNLERDKFIMLWLSLTRHTVKHNYHGRNLDFLEESRRLALTGKAIWDLLPKSWAVEDIYVYPLGDASGLWVNLLVDAGTNHMTKIVLFPELYYGKEKFSYDLVNKSSKDLKRFAVYK
jgi:hypothetical protein